MNPPPTPTSSKRGFTLIEILVVVAIIGVLAAILLPAMSKALSASHVSRTLADLQQLKGYVADGANQLGGTLPLTKGYASLSAVVNSAASPNLSSSAAADFNQAMRLEDVLLCVPSPKLGTYFTPACGSQIFSPAGGTATVDPRYNAATGAFYNAPDSRILPGYGYASVSRLDCALVDAAQTPGTLDSSGGTNFRLDGVSNLPAGRVAYAVIKSVPGPEAFQIATAINTPAFMDDTSASASMAQLRGQVAYTAAIAGVTDVYVYLGNF
jgi:prepilin-type N-terminal cleavage/methylation domain-containing protein